MERNSLLLPSRIEILIWLLLFDNSRKLVFDSCERVLFFHSTYSGDSGEKERERKMERELTLMKVHWHTDVDFNVGGRKDRVRTTTTSMYSC